VFKVIVCAVLNPKKTKIRHFNTEWEKLFCFRGKIELCIHSISCVTLNKKGNVSSLYKSKHGSFDTDSSLRIELCKRNLKAEAQPLNSCVL
jgi:hypothetical protein